MVGNPGVLLDDFAEAGADRCIVHVELGDPQPLFDELRTLGVGVGLTLNPETPVEDVLPYLDEIDLLLVMSVHPGFGGQPSSPRCSTRCASRARRSTSSGLPVEIEIDGGIKVDTRRDGRGRRCRHPRRRRARSSTPPTRRVPRARDPRRCPAQPERGRRRGRAREGPHRLRRRRRGRARRQVRRRARRPPHGSRVRGRRAPRSARTAVVPSPTRSRPRATASPAWSSPPAAPASAPATSRPRARAR